MDRIPAALLLLLAPLGAAIAADEPPADGGDSAAVSSDASSQAEQGANAEGIPAVPRMRVEAFQGSVAEQVDLFETTKTRFIERMGEFKEDAREYVELVKASKNAQITQGYGRIISGLREDEEALRTLAKARFESFLASYPSAESAPHVMFRLAELYYEDAEEEFLLADQRYMALLETMDLAEMEEPPPAPKKDYGKAVALYERIIGDHQDYASLDGVYYMLGYCYTEVNSTDPQPEKGLAALTELVDRFPDSEFNNDANMKLGETYFDNSLNEKAIVHYQRIVDSGEDARHYDKGLYKLAWSHYRAANSETPDEYVQALTLFVKLLDYSRRMQLSTGKTSAIEPEAVQYMAISFADMGFNQKENPVHVAERFFQSVGEREFELEIFERLAEVLIEQANYDKAIVAYEYLQKRWPLNAKNPEFQHTVAQLHMTGPIKDVEASARAELLLAERYNDSTDWWTANRNNPDALAVAREHTESSLANVAVDFHLVARESNLPEDYSRAADKYREYLRRFPFADDYYEKEWYLADALVMAERTEEAEQEFLQLLKTDAHPYGDGALFRLMQARQKLLVDKYGEVQARPENAIVEKTVETEFGEKYPAYMLTDEHKSFIEVADKVVVTPFKDPDFASAREKNLPPLHYLPAQIYYEFGQYDEARKRFRQVIAKFPETKEAAFSAGLDVAIAKANGDLAEVASLTGHYLELVHGTSEDIAEKRKEWELLNQQSLFKLANQLAQDGRRDLAAEAFLDFMERFPESDMRMDAHFSAANNKEQIGRADEANALFEDYINLYPSDERSEGLYFRIAGNYSAILELDKAIKYYAALVKHFPKSKNAAAALYNSAFLRIGLGQNASAARDFEVYATRYPDLEDAEPTFFLAGEQWEAVGQREALEFYRRYLKRYPGVDADHSMIAQYEIVQLVKEQGRERQINEEWDRLLQMYGQIVESGRTSAIGARYAAEASFRPVADELVAFKDFEYTGDQEKDAQMLLETKLADLDVLVEHCLDLMKTYQDFTYSSAALFVQADAYFAYAEMLFNMPPPPGLTEEQIIFYQEQLDGIRTPVEAKGRARAEANLTAAKDKGLWTEWQSKTLELLNSRFPREFPAEKLEMSYQSRPLVEPQQGALTIELPSEEDEAPQIPNDASQEGGG